MKTLIVSQTALVLLGTGLLLALNTLHGALSYASGSGLALLNFLILATGWSLIFKKKLIAVAVFIVVIKYAILGLLLYILVHQPWLDSVWLAVGIMSFVVSALIYAKGQHGI